MIADLFTYLSWMCVIALAGAFLGFGLCMGFWFGQLIFPTKINGTFTRTIEETPNRRAEG